MGNNKWEKLTELPEEYQVNPGLAKNAMQSIQEEQTKVKGRKGWWKLHWRKVVYSFAACALCVGMFIPIYDAYIKSAPITSSSSSPITPPPVYYADEKVKTEDIIDVQTYLVEKQVQTKFFSTTMTTSQAGLIAEMETFAYLSQQLMYIDATGFEQIGLYAVVLPNMEFSFQKDYDSITQTVAYQQIAIEYGTTTNKTGSTIVLAKFINDGVRYYLEIQTAGEAEAKVLQYVEMLMQS